MTGKRKSLVPYIVQKGVKQRKMGFVPGMNLVLGNCLILRRIPGLFSHQTFQPPFRSMARSYTLAHQPPPTAAQLARKRAERAVLKCLLFLTALFAMNLWLT